MSKKVLVAYASKAGATAGIAGAIGTELTARGHDVDVLDVNRVKNVTQYDVVILGSALYIRRWRRDAVRFLRHNADALRGRQVWLFHSGPVGPDKDQAQDMPPAVRRLAQDIGATPAVTFAGSLEPDTARGFLARRLASSDLAGDSRDWTKIRAWATGISTAVEAPEHSTNHRPATTRSRKHATRPPAGHFLG
ncbi:flavodoxin domain-containing protein [Kribbella sindirgiensis]|uniref:Flavodoxin n=1 Tax=Kribbella sindirgiensis TaxID=1124744 RepID=A0A4R0I031_9ACTN|nr:flavodoxin domain-containing protein [Kribbella sindirgiensis]TCC16075.1 flavodoxin [Kribbella sindirgiensis]